MAYPPPPGYVPAPTRAGLTEADVRRIVSSMGGVGDTDASVDLSNYETYIPDGLTTVGDTATSSLMSPLKGGRIPPTDEGTQWHKGGGAPSEWYCDTNGAWSEGSGGQMLMIDMGSNDHELQYLYGANGGGATDCGIVFRYTDPRNFYYLDTFQGGLRFIKVVDASLTVISSGFQNISTGQTFKARIQGGTQKFYLNGSLIGAGQFTDTSLTTGTLCGLKMGTQNVGYRWKNFLATAL